MKYGTILTNVRCHFFTDTYWLRLGSHGRSYPGVELNGALHFGTLKEHPNAPHLDNSFQEAVVLTLVSHSTGRSDKEHSRVKGQCKAGTFVHQSFPTLECPCGSPRQLAICAHLDGPAASGLRLLRDQSKPSM